MIIHLNLIIPFLCLSSDHFLRAFTAKILYFLSLPSELHDCLTVILNLVCCLIYEFLIMQYLPVSIYSWLLYPYIFVGALLPDIEIYILLSK
jgi:hypothetical protein